MRPGDTVAVVAPSAPINRDRLTASLPILEARYRVRIADDIFARDGYLAGSDERRAGELIGALRDPDVRAIFVARGGYGLTRILPLLDPSDLIGDPVPIIGFSDVTALLGWAWARANLASIHGPVVRQFAELPPADIAWLFELLENPRPDLAPHTINNARACSGTLWGGNLSLVSNCSGSPSWPSAPADALFFFEEVGERPYSIDRYLTSLHARGALANVNNALIGQLTRCVETVGEAHPSSADVVSERLASFGVATANTPDFGHGSPNMALPFGGQAVLEHQAGTSRLTLRTRGVD